MIRSKTPPAGSSAAKSPFARTPCAKRNAMWPGWLLALMLLCRGLAAAPLPASAAVPGGLALVPLEAEAAYFQGERLMLVPSAGTALADKASRVALVGIPLSAKPGEHQIELDDGAKVSFMVGAKEYPVQRLTIANKRKVNPYAEDMERIRRERGEMLAALGNWRLLEKPPLRFQKPVQGPYSSLFGLKRVLNDQPRSPHSGLDIAAPRGTPVVAPASGQVTAVGQYFFNGNNVILDHGQGLVSMYSHLDHIEVAKGDRLDAGDLIGTVGDTGRVTGPHLHWSLSLNNARVDPALFLAPEDRP